MRVQYCFRCRRELPMLDEQEYAHFWELYRQCSAPLGAYVMEHGRSPGTEAIAEMFRPMLDEFERLTGRRDVEPKAIINHRLADYGPPCRQCGRPLRTPRASKCMECGSPKNA
jgi:hypothetical protein